MLCITLWEPLEEWNSDSDRLHLYDSGDPSGKEIETLSKIFWETSVLAR